MQAIITAEFLESIPLPIRQRLKLRPGTVMDFDEEVPYLKAVPASVPDAAELAQFQDWLKESTGLAAGKFTTDERMKETRGDPLESMMACVGIGKGKGHLGGMSSSEWLDATRGPVALPPEV